jgi:hypothetical protein
MIVQETYIAEGWDKLRRFYTLESIIQFANELTAKGVDLSEVQVHLAEGLQFVREVPR